MDVITRIHGSKVSLGVIYLKVLLARSQRKVAESCLLALLYPWECYQNLSTRANFGYNHRITFSLHEASPIYTSSPHLECNTRFIAERNVSNNKGKRNTFYAQ